MRGFLHAACALPMALFLCATPASATAMLVNVLGDWNDIPGLEYWTLEFQYNPAGMYRYNLANGYEYRWQADPGGASIIHYAKASYYGVTCDPPYAGCDPEPWQVHQTYDGDDFTSFKIGFYDDYRLVYSFSGLKGSFEFGHYLQADPYPGHDKPLYVSGYGEYGTSPTFHQIHTHVIDTQVTAVPEPATWALLITGFGLTGAALRAARRKPLPA